MTGQKDRFDQSLTGNFPRISISPMGIADNSSHPTVGYFSAGEAQRGEVMALAEIHGDQWCVFGDSGLSDFVNDPLFYSKLQVFGFPLSK